MDEGRILWVACFFFLLLLNVATNNQIKRRRIQRKWVVNKQKGQDSGIQCSFRGTIIYTVIGRFNSTFCSLLPATMQLFQVLQWNDSIKFYRINQHVNVGRLQTWIPTSDAALIMDGKKHLFCFQRAFINWPYYLCPIESVLHDILLRTIFLECTKNLCTMW